MKITNIDVGLSSVLREPYVCRYQILIDEPAEKVLAVFRKNEPKKIFTLPVYTGKVSEVPSFEGVIPSLITETDEEYEEFMDCVVIKEGLHHSLNPYYVGNLTPIEQAVSELERILFTGKFNSERVY